MSLGCLRLVLCHAARAVHQPVCSTRPASLLLPPKPPPCRPLSGYLGMALQQWSRFCTAAGGSEGAVQSKPGKKKHNLNARLTISSVGRRIPHLHVQLLGEDGADLGVLPRMQVLRTMDDSGLKLVLINEHSNPPVYQLMTGKQIHEERMKLKEKHKAKAAGIIEITELTLYSGITPHDLNIKLKQAAGWLEKKHHIRLTLKAKRGHSSDTTLDTVLEQMVEKLPVPVGFVSKCRLINEGQAATCILHPPTTKEAQQGTKRTENPTEPSRPEPGTTENNTSTSVPDPPKDSEQQ